MRRIRFVDPVDSMQGNLSGKQDLRYALNNNKAFESPAGQKNFAKNYQTRYIGARRASDGLKYFAVKTKSATHTTQAALMAMALMGGSGAMYAAIIKDKASTLYAAALTSYEYRGPEHANESMREYLMTIIRNGLANKYAPISLSSQLSISNPWSATNTGADATVTIATKTVAKFMPQLGVNCIKFAVDKIVWAAFSGYTWTALSHTPQQSFGKALTEETIGQETYIKTNGKFILNSSLEYQKASDAIVEGASYTTTNVAPEA